MSFGWSYRNTSLTAPQHSVRERGRSCNGPPFDSRANPNAEQTRRTFVKPSMQKILIIGSSGAGKSTFAKQLGEITGIEVVHLDKVYWRPNWVEMPKDEWRKTVAHLLAGDTWIMDGNYG